MCNFQELKSKKTSSSSGFTSGGEGENSMRKSSMSVYEFHWSWMENLAFAFSMAVLLSSYTASVLYIFRHCFLVLFNLKFDFFAKWQARSSHVGVTFPKDKDFFETLPFQKAF